MATTVTQQDKRYLPLHKVHEELGAKFIQFGQWEVPVSFTSIVNEHKSVRTKAGIFDISHMGELRVNGAQADAFVDFIATNETTKISNGQTLYTCVCNDKGGILDDIILYKLGTNSWLIIVNASNIEKIYNWFKGKLSAFEGASVQNLSNERGILAVQGPLAVEIGSKLFKESLTQLRHRSFTQVAYGGKQIVLSRTGYTGEPGFELFFDQDLSFDLWNDVTRAGGDNLTPAGFGARDSLRLEAGLVLYGNDMDENTTPLEASLGWTVGKEKKQFVGREAIQAQKALGLKKKLVGFEIQGRAIARHGYDVYHEEKKIGVVTSGTFSPILEKSVGFAMIDFEYHAVGIQIDIDIRNKKNAAIVVKAPFYKSPYLKKG